MECTLYVPGNETDLLLLQWWGELQATQELEEVFTEPARTPSGFLQVFRQAALFYALDEQGIYYASWFERFLGGLAAGLWVRKDWRHQRWHPLAIDVLGCAFEHTPLVVCFTKREHVVRTMLDLGFTTIGSIPYLYEGHTAWIAHLTREAYEERHGTRRTG